MNHGPGSINRIFRLVWSDVTSAFVAVPENTRGRGKRSSGVAGALAVAATVAASGVSAAGPPPPPPAPTTLPTGGKVVAGQASVTQTGALLNVNQTTDKAAINWTTFNIGAAAQVNFAQPSANSVALNRVVTGDASAIYGRLTANGQVLIVNPNGIVFGPGSQVDASGIAASTLKIGDADFMAGKLRFERDGATGSVVNGGTLTAGHSGYVALLAPEVRNEGTITANLGTVALAAGDIVTLDVSGNKLLAIRVDPATIAALVENRSMVRADGGQVIMSAGAANRLLEQAVTTGQNGATTLASVDGVVRLVANSGSVVAAAGSVAVEGSLVDVSGRIDTSGTHGGSIAIAADWLTQGGALRADGTAGRGGSVAVATGHAVQTASAILSADGSTGGGTVSLAGTTSGQLGAGSGRIYSSATLQARGTGAGASGGHIDVTADSVQLRAATVDASGVAGGGSLRIGGGFQGKDATIANAVEVGINGTTVLRADAAESGNGGQAVIWADSTTTFAGQLSARGGAASGAGGQAEVSGKGLLTFGGRADLSAAHGKAGSLLLDPHDIVIDDAAPAIAALRLDEPDGDPYGHFGDTVRVLTNGNVVITAPLASMTSAPQSGAAYLYNSQTGALLAQLRGDKPNDNVGDGGVEVLANQNYIVRSTNWTPVIATFDAGSGGNYNHYDQATAAAGALTFQTATGAGATPVFVSAANSLVGSGDTVSNDRVGNSAMTVLSNGNLVFTNGQWNNGRGAVTWMSASDGHLADSLSGGVVGAGNSLVGTTPIRTTALKEGDSYIVGVDQGATSISQNAGGPSDSSTPFNRAGPGDELGSGGITLLSGGRYVVSSPLWTLTSGETTPYVGAVSYGSAAGSTGVVDASNSLHGSSAFDFVGSGSIATVGAMGLDGLRTNYVVISPYWNSGGTFLGNVSAGAVTWVDGSTGVAKSAVGTGVAIDASNSLVGDAGDLVGAYGAYLQQYAGTDTHAWQYYYGGYRYSPNSYQTNFSAVRTVGGSLEMPDSVAGVAVLADGNYLVASPHWHGDSGAVSYGNGSAGVAGSVSVTNSLIGQAGGDRVSSSGIVQLANNAYVVDSPIVSLLGRTNVGAVTWAPAGGITGFVSSSNSMVGDANYDQVGLGGVLGVGAIVGGYSSNAIALSPYWRNGDFYATGGLGAVTFINGATGRAGAVSAANSLVGTTPGDYVGSFYQSDSRVGYWTGYGTYSVASGWRADLGATVDLLANGNYVVRSENWNQGRGAATWGSGATGVAGAVSGSNSLVGTTPDIFTTPIVTTRTNSAGTNFTDTTYNVTQVGDHVGMYGATTPTGAYFVVSPMWNGGRGAVTFVQNDGAVAGTGVPGLAVGVANSLTGTTADQLVLGTGGVITGISAAGDRVGTINSGDGLNFGVPVVSYVTSSGGSETATTTVAKAPYQLSFKNDNGYYNGNNVYTGSSYPADVSSLQPTIDVLPNGNAVIRSPNWNASTTATSAGAVTWVDDVGRLRSGNWGEAVDANNSLVGSHLNDLVGNLGINTGTPWLGGIVVLANGNYVVRSSQWNAHTGAVTWGDGAGGSIGVVSSANSLVGTRGDSTNAPDQVGSEGVFALPDGNYVVSSVAWNQYRGAATWVDGNTNHIKNTLGFGAEVGDGNSLVGSQDGDSVGNYGITVLAGGRYVVNSPNWTNGAAYAAGAVTFGDVGGIAGAVSPSNSLVGSTTYDNIGNYGITVLTDVGHTYTNYLVASPQWTDPLLGGNVGAATWVDGATGHVYGVTSGQTGAAVSAANSLVGTSVNDRVGDHIDALSRPVGADRVLTGDALVIANSWDLCTVADYGSVSLMPGATGIAGPVGWRNSVLGMQWTARYNSGYQVDQVSWEVLPDAATAVEKVTYRPLIWTRWGNSAAQVLSVVDEQTAYPLGTVGHEQTSVDHGDGSAWAAHSIFADDATGWAAAGGTTSGNFGLLAFGANPGSDVVITPRQITAMLNTGTSVTLQANNDITVAKAVIVDNPNGNGGTFVLEAGRSIHINADITTDNGGFYAFANESASNGVVGAQCETCIAQITMAPNTHIDTGSGLTELILQTSSDKARTWLNGSDNGGVNSAGDVIIGSIRGTAAIVANFGASIRTNTSETIDLYSTATSGGVILLAAGQHVVLGQHDAAQAVTIGGAGPVAVSLVADFNGLGHGGIVLDNVDVASNGGDISLGGGGIGGGYTPVGYASLANMQDDSLEHVVNGFLMQSGVALTGGTRLQAGTGHVSVLGEATSHYAYVYSAGGGEGGEGGYQYYQVRATGVDISAGNGVSAGSRRVSVDGASVVIGGRASSDDNGFYASGAGLNIAGADIGASNATSIVLRGEQGPTGRSYNTGMQIADATIGNAATTTAVTIEAGGFEDPFYSGGNIGSVMIGTDVAFTGRGDATLVVRAADPTVLAQIGDATPRGGYGTIGAPTPDNHDFWVSGGNLANVLAQSTGFSQLTFGRSDQSGPTLFRGITIPDTQLAASVSVLGGSGGLELANTTHDVRSSGAITFSAGSEAGAGTITVDPLTGFYVTGNETTLLMRAGQDIDLRSPIPSGVDLPSGAVILQVLGNGTVSTDGSVALTADRLLLKGGTGSDFALSTSYNTVNTLAADAGSIDFVNQGTLTIGSVADLDAQTTSGVHTAQRAWLEARGGEADLVLDAAVSNRLSTDVDAERAGDIVLAAGRDFTNNVAANTGLVPGRGHYYVYSGNPDDSTEGMTQSTSLTTPDGYLWHYAQDYQRAEGEAPATPAYAQAAGNWMLYRIAPVLHVGSVSSHITYGDADATPVPAFDTRDLIGGDTLLLGGPTGTAAFTLTPITGSETLSSSGHRVVGTYDETYTSGLASALGYTLVAPPLAADRGVMTVDQKGVTLVGSRVYDGTTDAAAATLTGMTGNLMGDGVSLAGGTGTLIDKHVGIAKGLASVGTLTLTGADAANYRIADTALTVTARSVTIGADAKTKVYGDADPALTVTIGGLGIATGDSQADVFSGAPSTTTGAAATAGTHVISLASLVAGGDYTIATKTDGTLTVAKAQLHAAADSKTKVYGDADPTLTFSVDPEDLRYTDTAAVVTGVTLSTTTGAAATAGTHAIAISGGTAANYVVVDVAGGVLTVAKAALRVDADNKTKTYGDADPALTYHIDPSQLKYADTAAVVSGVTLSTTTGAAATAGTHAINVAGGTADNYLVSVGPAGTLTVAKAQLVVSADAKSKVYGDADPTLTYGIDPAQLKYTDTAAVVTGVTLTTATGAAATAGTHAITLAGGTADNYVVSIGPGGVLTVAKAPLTVHADDKSKTYGDADPALTYSVDAGQLKYADTTADIRDVTLVTATGRDAGAGSHAITITGGNADNYLVTVGPGGTLTVAKAALTVLTDSKLQSVGNPQPPLTFSVIDGQLKYDDTLAVVNDLAITTTSTTSPGRYPIVASGGTAANYAISIGDAGYLLVQGDVPKGVDVGTLMTTLPKLEEAAPGITVQPVLSPDGDANGPGQLRVVLEREPAARLWARPLDAVGFAPGQAVAFVVPPTTFVRSAAIGSLRYTAHLSSGGELPSWLVFDAASLTFSGRPPAGFRGLVSVDIEATDDTGARATTTVVLFFGDA